MIEKTRNQSVNIKKTQIHIDKLIEKANKRMELIEKIADSITQQKQEIIAQESTK
jgi:hypothetical protein